MVFDNLKEMPLARCRVSEDGSQYIVDMCPLCGKPHSHGRPDPDDTRPGTRVSHCAGPGGNSTYELVVE